MGKALPGEHLCEKHQGDHSYYDEQNPLEEVLSDQIREFTDLAKQNHAQLEQLKTELDEALAKLALVKNVAEHPPKDKAILNIVNMVDGQALSALKRLVGAEAVTKAVNELERPDVPLAPSMILNHDLLDFAKRIKSGEITL